MGKREYKIIPINVGEFVDFEKSIFTYLRNFGQKLDAPCIVWLIWGGDEPILVDTGPCAPDMAERLHGYKMRLTEEQDLVQQLKRHGIEPTDINKLILTHLHWDHASNLHLFPNARIFVQARELHYAINPLRIHRISYEVNIVPPWMSSFDRFIVLNGDQEIVPGISVHLLPGHTPGSQGVAVETSSGKYLIAGDNVDLFENWDQQIPGAIFNDMGEYLQTFRKMAELADCILPAHDPLVFQKEFYS